MRRYEGDSSPSAQNDIFIVVVVLLGTVRLTKLGPMLRHRTPSGDAQRPDKAPIQRIGAR